MNSQQLTSLGHVLKKHRLTLRELPFLLAIADNKGASVMALSRALHVGLHSSCKQVRYLKGLESARHVAKPLVKHCELCAAEQLQPRAGRWALGHTLTVHGQRAVDALERV